MTLARGMISLDQAALLIVGPLSSGCASLGDVFPWPRPVAGCLKTYAPSFAPASIPGYLLRTQTRGTLSSLILVLSLHHQRQRTTRVPSQMRQLPFIMDKETRS